MRRLWLRPGLSTPMTIHKTAIATAGLLVAVVGCGVQGRDNAVSMVPIATKQALLRVEVGLRKAGTDSFASEDKTSLCESIVKELREDGWNAIVDRHPVEGTLRIRGQLKPEETELLVTVTDASADCFIITIMCGPHSPKDIVARIYTDGWMVTVHRKGDTDGTWSSRTHRLF